MNEDLAIGPSSAVLAAVVIGVAFLLAWRQRVESGRPRVILDEADRRYFHRQDRRRYRGVVLLAMLGLGIGVGGNIDIRAGDSERTLFLATWGVVFLMLLMLLMLAFLDLWSTRRYADRQRRHLLDERKRTLEREIVAYRERNERGEG